jgi:hypothetical protein
MSIFSTVPALRPTVSIRIVADCVALTCQVTRKLKRATYTQITHYLGYYFYTLLGIVSFQTFDLFHRSIP